MYLILSCDTECSEGMQREREVTLTCDGHSTKAKCLLHLPHVSNSMVTGKHYWVQDKPLLKFLRAGELELLNTVGCLKDCCTAVISRHDVCGVLK